MTFAGHSSETHNTTKRNWAERKYSPTSREQAFSTEWVEMANRLHTFATHEKRELFDAWLHTLKQSIDTYEILSKRTQASKEESQATG